MLFPENGRYYGMAPMIVVSRQYPGLLAILAWMVAGGGVLAQVRMIQGGNALDANPMTGSGGINYAAPVPPINSANRLMTRNAGGGASFRGYSPIRDSSQFFINLPSSGLSGFRANGISVGDLLAGQSNFEQRDYYDPSRTMTNVGGLQRQQPTGAPGSRTPYESPHRRLYPVSRDPIPFRPTTIDQPTGTGLALEPELARTGNPRLLASPLFAQYYNVPLSQVRRLPPPSDAAGSQVGPFGRRQGPPLEVESSPPATAIESPLDRVLRRQAEPPLPISPAPAPIAEPYVPAEAPAPAGAEPTAPDWLGRDYFHDMSLAAQAVRDRVGGSAWIAGGAPPLTGGTGSGALARHAAWVEDYLSRPVTTFAGSSPTVVNNYLSRAEEAMHGGNYYRAASLYAAAASAAPDNPLPLLGRAYALAAAGEYMTASDQLARAIERFPGAAYFRISLKSFLPDAKLFDSRRAEIERILRQNEDYRLRFLLGYLEYYSGFTVPGLENLARAAVKAPGQSPIARFPELLKRGRQFPVTTAPAGEAVPSPLRR